jgi:L-arabinose isomerase
MKIMDSFGAGGSFSEYYAIGRFKLLVAEAISESGPILEIGNTNGRYRFSSSARNFANAWNEQGPAHHCALGAGHISSKLQEFAFLLGIEYSRIC